MAYTIIQVRKKEITRNGRGAESEPYWRGSRRQLCAGRKEESRQKHMGIFGSYGFLTFAKDPSQYKQGMLGEKKLIT